jgi:DNA invertase Pin-like site-specific DNA recombinase
MSHLNLPDGAWAVIYCRVSDPAQSGIPAQRKWAQQRARELAVSVVADLDDDGISGDDMDRPGLQALEDIFRRAAAERRPVLVLLIDQPDRLSRADSIDTSALLSRLRGHGLRYVVTATRVYDLKDAMDRTLFLIESDHKSNPYLRDLARRSLRGTIEIALAGFWSGRTPVGFKLVRKPGDHPPGKRRRSGRLAEDEVTGPVMRELPQRYLDGASTVALARWLDLHVPCPYSPSWTPQAVTKILRNRIYTGVRLLGKAPAGKHAAIRDGDAALLDDDQGGDGGPVECVIRIPNVAPALWSEKLFQDVQDRLAGGRRRNRKAGAAAPLPLSLLGKCGHCEGNLHCARDTGPHGNRERLIYCGNRHAHGAAGCSQGSKGTNHDTVLARILATLAEHLLEDNAVEKLTEQARKVTAAAAAKGGALRKKIERKLAENRGRTGRARERLADAPADILEEYQELLRTLRKQRTSLEQQLKELDKEKLTGPGADGGEEALKRWLALCRKVCRPGSKLTVHDDDGGTFNALLGELIKGFVVYWKKSPNRHGQTLDRVEVELPPWLTALLATSASAS